MWMEPTKQSLEKKEERRTYPSKPVLYDRRVNKDRRHRESIDIKI